MKIRLAALITICAAALLWYTEPLKSEDLAGVCISEKSDSADAIAACTTLINASETPQNLRFLFYATRAEALHRNNQYARAVEDADLALTFYPERTRTLVWRAYSNNALDNQTATLEDVERALQIDDDNTYVLYNKAKLHRIQGNFDASIADYEKTLEIDPDHQDAFDDLVNLRYGQEDYESVREMLVVARTRWPDSDWVYEYSIISFLKGDQDLPVALQIAEAYVEKMPSSQDGRLFLALIHFALGDDERGIENVGFYAKLNLAKRYSEMAFVDGWFERFSNWVVVGQNSEWIVRAILLSKFGQKELARNEMHNFLRTAGTNGRKFLLHIVRKEGVTVSQLADTGSEEHLNQAISDYVNHMFKKTDFGTLYSLPQLSDS